MKPEECLMMTGTDHRLADLSVREPLAFTRAGAAEAMKRIARMPGVGGCVILSTCNRTELWISVKEETEAEPDLPELLCRTKSLDPGQYREYLVTRRGGEAAAHLMEVAAGRRSRLPGEDQILTQVGEALSCAREAAAAGAVLEKLFQTAAAAAKEIKTAAASGRPAPSAAEALIPAAAQKFGTLKGLPCLIIGSGRMARLAAEALFREGAGVRVTLRRQTHGCRRPGSAETFPAGLFPGVPYEDRLRWLEASPLVVSATRSPHHTVRLEDLDPELKNQLSRKSRLWIDLAVPRDLDPEIARAIPSVTLLDVDTLTVWEPEKGKAEREAEIQAVLDRYLETFLRWIRFRPYVDFARTTASLCGTDAVRRMEKALTGAGLAPPEREALERRMEEAVRRSVEKLTFGLREHLPPGQWDAAERALMEAAGRETLKR